MSENQPEDNKKKIALTNDKYIGDDRAADAHFEQLEKEKREKRQREEAEKQKGQKKKP